MTKKQPPLSNWQRTRATTSDWKLTCERPLFLGSDVATWSSLTSTEQESEQAMCTRLTQAIQMVRKANQATAAINPDGQPKHIWLSYSQTPERRRRASGRVCHGHGVVSGEKSSQCHGYTTTRTSRREEPARLVGRGGSHTTRTKDTIATAWRCLEHFAPAAASAK